LCEGKILLASDEALKGGGSMKYSVPLLASLVLLFGLAQYVSSQPVVDLTIQSLDYYCVSPDSIVFEALVAVRVHGFGGPFATGVGFELDGDPVTSLPLSIGPVGGGTCPDHVPPNCDGDCPAIDMNGEMVEGICINYADEGCACLYLQTVNSDPVPIAAPAVFTSVVDPDNLVEEIDETNNVMEIFAGPSPIQGTTWGTVKSLYR
jgi:hypothetical protein